MGKKTLEDTHREFDTTRWTLIDDLRGGSADRYDLAAEALFHRYWPAAYAFCRRSGRGRDEAAELVQGFFADVVVGRKFFERADPGRGRLRTYIITSLENYAKDRHRYEVARGSLTKISIEEIERHEEALRQDGEVTPEEAFEIMEAKWVLEETMDRCRRYFKGIGKPSHWDAYRIACIRPAISGCTSPPLAAVAAETGFPSATHVASAFSVVRKQFQTRLREVVAETVQDPDDLESECRRIIAVLS